MERYEEETDEKSLNSQKLKSIEQQHDRCDDCVTIEGKQKLSANAMHLFLSPSQIVLHMDAENYKPIFFVF